MSGNTKFVRKGWRKLRVIVEVTVCGDYSTRDLVWDIERLAGGSHLNQLNAKKITGRKVLFGKVAVKEAERMIKVLQEEKVKKIQMRINKEKDRLLKITEEMES